MPGDQLTDAELSRLREALLSAGYTVDGVAEVLTARGHRALARGETTAGLRAVTGDDGLSILTRLFLLSSTETADSVAFAFARFPVERLITAGVLVDADGWLRAGLDIRPYGDPDVPWYVVSDMSPPRDADHVLGVGGASLTLASAVPRRAARTALDVGTGCGIQALHLSTHAGSVVATDVNARALSLAHMTAVLSDTGAIEFVAGDFIAPVADRTFDVIVSNPPFVVGPRQHFSYRDSGLPGDDASRRVITEAAAHLADNGIAVVLANWLHRAGEDWRTRVSTWLHGTGCDAWALQRETQDPAEYAELWLRDAGETGENYARRYGEWLDWFDERAVDEVGFGIVLLHRTSAQPVIRIDEARQQVEGSFGDVFAGWLDRVDVLRSADALLATHCVPAPGVVLEQRMAPSGGGEWGLEHQSVVQQGGLRLRGEVDEVGAAVLAACDGRAPLGVLVDVLVLGHGVERAAAIGVLRRLVDDGFLVPVDAR